MYTYSSMITQVIRKTYCTAHISTLIKLLAAFIANKFIFPESHIYKLYGSLAMWKTKHLKKIVKNKH